MLLCVDQYHLDAKGGKQGAKGYIYPRVRVVSQTRDKLICYLNGVIVKHASMVITFETRKIV